MPEGHTIRRQVVDQAPGLVGHDLRVSSPNRRFQAGAARLDGRHLEAMDAWGKNLFYFFSGRQVLHVHLGMDGRFRLQRRRPALLRASGEEQTTADGAGEGREGEAQPLRFPPARPTTWVRVSGPDLAVDLSTPKVCRLIDVVAQRRLVERLGPDPIRTDDDGGTVVPRLASYGGSIGIALLDQSLVAGIGNVYRAEILFDQRIHPERPASSVGVEEWAGLWATAVRMLREGVANRGDIRTVDRRDLRVRDRRQTYVYGQRSCARCGSVVRRWDLMGRVCYACETCQPPP